MSLLPPGSPLRTALGYRKFARAQATILLLDSNYHLHSECRDALTALGQRVVTLRIGGEGGAQNASTAMQQLLSAMLQHRPDMVLTINHIGFDAHDSMGQLLDEVEMPVAVWYVDSPFLLFDGYFLPARKVTSVFVWDRDYVPLLRACGADEVAYLPLGCDPKKFAGTPPPTPEPGVGFVGNSMAFAEQKWRKRLLPDGLRAGRRMAQQLLAGRKNFSRLLGVPKAPQDPHITALAYATWTATGTYRQAFLSALCRDGRLQVFGDAGWQRLLPQARRHPYVCYGAPLAQIYGRLGCHFNATSLQMPTAVNQRVFDVPAAGGLVLTDAQPDALELFEPDEMTVYRSPEELVDLTRYYLSHPEARAERVQRGRARVLRDHTYARRCAALLRAMRARWGVQPSHRRAPCLSSQPS